VASNPWSGLISCADDLTTSRTATRDGFLKQALQKTQKANPYVQRAEALLTALSRVEAPEDLLDRADFRDDLIVASGFSEKARDYIAKWSCVGLVDTR
jgi:hypothetical protein